MNIKRHPCGGRNFEYLSEDLHHLTGILASSLVEGVQSQGVGTCIKHFCVNNQETSRMRVNVLVDERTLREVYWKGFKMVIKQTSPIKQPWCIMGAYNKVNGVYCCENEEIWKVVRDEWKFRGVVMTDWGATNDRVIELVLIIASHKLSSNNSHGCVSNYTTHWIVLLAYPAIKTSVLQRCRRG